jgi:chromosome segregation ATPase
MVRGKQVLQASGAVVSPEELSDQMAVTFREALESRRERYIYELIAKLQSIQHERDELEESVHSESSAVVEVGASATQNDVHRSELESLENELRVQERRIARRESVCQERLRERTHELASLSGLVVTVQSSTRQLSREIGDLRASVATVRGGQLGLLRQSRIAVTNRARDVIEAAVRRCEEDRARRISRSAAELVQLQNEQSTLENHARTLIDVAAEITGDARLRSIGVEEFPDRVPQIQNAIEEAVEGRRDAAVARLKEEISRQFPGIEFGGESVAAAVRNHIRERIRAKEHECREILRKGEMRERRLREKLEEALRRVHKLQGHSGEDFRFLEEFERSKRDWEEQRRKLDAKMSALVSGQGSNDYA